MPTYCRQLFVCLLTLIVAVPLTACGRGSNEPDARITIRQPRATFTPTSPPPPTVTTAVDSSPQTGTGGVEIGDTQQQRTPGLPVRVVVNTPLVNARSAPNTDSTVLGIVERGQEFEVLAQNEAGDWWNVCCYEGQQFWLFDDLVDTIEPVGGTDSQAQQLAPPGEAPAAPVIEPTSAPAQPPTSAPSTVAPQPTIIDEDPAVVDFTFDLRLQEQFSEAELVRIFLYVYSEQVQALEGYSLRVTKDGVELPVNAQSFGPQAGFTWPVAGERQRFQNFKVEYPDLEAAGTWVLQLIDSRGSTAGPPATFTLTANDPNRELYVRYEQN